MAILAATIIMPYRERPPEKTSGSQPGNELADLAAGQNLGVRK